MEPVWVLHRWPWQEHGLLVELFSRSHGRLRVIAKGAKRSKSPWKAALQPLVLNNAQWAGRSELKTLTHAEPEQSVQLSGHYLYSALYMNELLQRMLPANTELPGLFDDYTKTLGLLEAGNQLEPVLRRFEWQLLQRLELDFSWSEEAAEGARIEPELNYKFLPEHGFVLSTPEISSSVELSGAEIAALAAFDLHSAQRLQQFKQLMRQALSPYLGSKPLQSRALFNNSGVATAPGNVRGDNN